MSPSSLCSSISAVVALNTKGIQNLESKDFAMATSCLSSAISDLKRCLVAHSSEDNQDALERPCHDVTFGFEMAHLEEASCCNDDADTVSFVFDAPIRVTQRRMPNKKTPSRSAAETLKMLCFALVFNLAVAVHLGALHHSSCQKASSTKKALLKALTFYKMSLTMIHTDDLSLGTMESLAVSNNQANVHRLLGQTKQADACKEDMLSNIMCVTACGQQKTIPLFERFLANALVQPTLIAEAA